MLFFLILGIYGVLIYTVVCSVLSLNPKSAGSSEKNPDAAADKLPALALTSGVKAFILFAFAVPNTVLFVIVFWIFFNCHPTAQFNAGSDSAMDYWSFWVHQYFAFLQVAVVLCAVHFFALVVACFVRNGLISIAFRSLICSAIVWWVIFVSAPTA